MQITLYLTPETQITADVLRSPKVKPGKRYWCSDGKCLQALFWSKAMVNKAYRPCFDLKLWLIKCLP